MDRQQRREDLIRFLRTIQRPDRPIEEIDEHENLISAGLYDSLAVLEIVSHLEQTYNIDFAERGVDPGELSSVAGILDLIAQNTA
jgi:acyl carrier protein